MTTLWGVGSERARQLQRLGIFTVEDLLLHKPRRYEDRRNLRTIAELQLDESATVRGKIIAAGVKRWKKGTRALFECIVDDGTAKLHCRWWQMQPWMEDYYAVGREFLVFGKPETLRPRTIDHPETERIEPDDDEFIHVSRIAPIHPLTEGLTARAMRTLVWRALEKFESQITEPTPEPGLKMFPARAKAIRMTHFPEALGDIELARKRLALDEFLQLQSAMRARRKNFEAKSQGLPCGGNNRLMKPFLARIGFKLTGAQTRVLREIRKDLGGAHPMRRLLQGDVGSGKTLVAACSALMAIESGFSVALMAPTEILAEQHSQNFRRWFEPLGIKVQLQTGSRKSGADDRWQMADGKRRPTPNSELPTAIFIGTHALLTGGFEIPNLGLVIIDEQHKFGVSQREQLVRKGNYPHLLVMTATPIPRTLGLTLYGDLDFSVLDEMPPGRGEIKTFVRTAEKLPQVWEFIRKKLGEGRQAYVVYPRIEETAASGLKAVVKEFEKLKSTFAPHKVGLLHGGLRTDEKEKVVDAFRRNTINVLFATAVVEVGLDVANATVMVVENAERFGLAQLHQLRGRIGRGAHDSFCVLINAATGNEAAQRLKILEETSDGFRIAEADLKLRGPGELLGQEQSGMPRFRFGNLAEDLELIEHARRLAAQLVG